MIIPVYTLFQKISRNNLIVDQVVDSLVATACKRFRESTTKDKQELEKTSKLLFWSSLLQGDKEG
jgi:hypothetical protein